MDQLDLVLAVLQDCWYDFYSWKDQESSQVMSALKIDPGRNNEFGSPAHSPWPDLAALDPELGASQEGNLDMVSWNSDSQSRLEELKASSCAGSWTVTEYLEDSGESETFNLPTEVITIPQSHRLHPAYISCQLGSQNEVAKDDDCHLPFIPFSDDPSFDHEDYCWRYPDLAWNSLSDPDGKCCCIFI